jgi:hypothetical protein
VKSFLYAVAAMVALAAAPAGAFGVNSSSGSLTVQNTTGTTGACTANSCILTDISFSSPGTIFSPTWAVYDTITVQVTGTWSGTITFQASQDEGATWFAVPVFPYPGSNVKPSVPLPVTTTTANGNWIFDAGGATTFRAVMSTFTSGSATVVLEKQQAEEYVGIDAVPPSQNSQNVSYAAMNAETVPTAAQALQAVEADGTNRLYLRHLKVCLSPTAAQTTAGLRTLVLYKTTAASSGGSTSTPNPLDAADGAFGGVVRTGALTTTPAIGATTVTTSLAHGIVGIGAAVGTNLVTNICWEQYFGDQQGQMKPPTVAKAVANGLAIGDLTGGAGGTGSYNIEMDVTAEPQ